MRYYSVSKLATIVGENPYENPCDMFEQIWKKEDADSYFASLKRNKPTQSYQNDQNVLHDALRHEETKTMIETSKLKDNITDTVDSITETKMSLDENAQTLVKKYVKSSFSTKHGTRNETSALNLYRSETKEDVHVYNIMLNKSFDRFTIRGKIDGIVNKDKSYRKVIEIKNRTKRLFYEVRMYEMIQVQVYMNILEAKTADLVEHYKGQLNVSNIDYDENIIDTVYHRLQIFDNNLTKIVHDKEYQTNYFSSPDRSEFIFHS
jgi:hypothetical protein